VLSTFAGTTSESTIASDWPDAGVATRTRKTTRTRERTMVLSGPPSLRAPELDDDPALRRRAALEREPLALEVGPHADRDLALRLGEVEPPARLEARARSTRE